ncbi:MAG: hypothetical protein ACI957_002737, partial [Verrucomicrobiales bacterium]
PCLKSGASGVRNHQSCLRLAQVSTAFHPANLTVNLISQGKGKLRAFLLHSLKNHLVDHHGNENAAKRGGGQQVLSIDRNHAEALYEMELLDEQSPDVLFERSWAMTLLQDVLTKLQQSYERAQKVPIFEAMSPCLLRDETPNYRGLSKQLGLTVVALRFSSFE